MVAAEVVFRRLPFALMKRLCPFQLGLLCLVLAMGARAAVAPASSPLPPPSCSPPPAKLSRALVDAGSHQQRARMEILPQAAGPGEVILSKRNELRAASNFAPTPFTLRGKRYASVEGFWQMMKYPEGVNDPRTNAPEPHRPYTRDEVAQMTAFDAKRAGDLAGKPVTARHHRVSFEGRHVEYRPAKPGTITASSSQRCARKVRQNPDVKKVLLATGNLILRPDHQQESNAPAARRYYDI